MSRRFTWMILPPLPPQDDVMVAGKERLDRPGTDDVAGEESPGDDPDDEEDWESSWRPPGLDSLRLLLLAEGVESPNQRKPN